jgi:RimJ/RimL family protein N-acetyltransferase
MLATRMAVDIGPEKRSPFEGRLIRLRAREPADLGRLNEMFDDPEVLAGLKVAFPQSMEGIRDWFDRTQAAENMAIFVIEAPEDPNAVGVCALEGIDARARSATFGIWIGKAYWGRGFGTDATGVICRFAFRHMNLQRVELRVYATNLRAVRAYEKVGFRLEGTLRRAQFLGGEPVDVHVMGLLADELNDDDPEGWNRPSSSRALPR